MKYSEFLYTLAEELDKIISPEHYLCCHLEGVYLDKKIYSRKSEKYVELITSPEHKKHRARLKTTIGKKISRYNKTNGSLSSTLSYSLEQQNITRIQWLQSLAKLHKSKGN